MEHPERREVGGRVPLGSNGPGGQRQDDDPMAEGPTTEFPKGEDTAEDEFRRRLGEKDRHIEELYDEISALRVATDEAVAKAEAGDLRVGDIEEERARLKERVRVFEEEERRRRRRREGQDRRVDRLQREIERREAEIQRLQDLLEEKDREMEAHARAAGALLSRKESALEDALRRIDGLQRDLEGRENDAEELRAAAGELRAELDLEYERRRRMAEPENRLRAGLELFNSSEHPASVDEISRSLGQPEVHVTLEKQGDEPPVILTFVWGGATWRTYAANPGLAVEEPRIYQVGGGVDPSGVDREPPNAHISPDGQVVLGL